jgi:serine protease AprX
LEVISLVRAHRSFGSESAIAANACPLCGRLLTAEIWPLITQIEAPVRRALERRHPAWRASNGACPECVQLAAADLRLRRSRTSIQDELLLPYPIYTRDDQRLLLAYELIGAGPQYSGQGVTLAFLDSGFYPHPDLTRPKNRILCYVDATGAQPVETDSFNKPLISSWHGLMTSCVAAGNGSLSDQLYRGIAYQANLVLVKTGNSEGRGIREADIQRSLAWVLANYQRFNIKVVNISLGGDHPANGKLSELDQLVEKVVDCGIVVVAAAGNDGAERLVSPASAPSAITVGGLDSRNTYDRRLWQPYHSNYGRVANTQLKPEILAPAVWLAAPMLPHTRVHNEGVFLCRLDRTIDHLLQNNGQASNFRADEPRSQLEAMRRKLRKRMIEQKYIHPFYQHVDGTSMAAPVVSATVGLMLEANPALNPAQVKQILMSTAMPLEDFPAHKSGAGLVDAGRAVAAARRAARGIWETLPFSPDVQADKVGFYYFDPTNCARRVAVIGGFNGWNPVGFELSSRSPGLWQISLPQPAPGSYTYKFLVDDDWVHDPENLSRVEDGYGGFSSILEVRP